MARAGLKVIARNISLHGAVIRRGKRCLPEIIGERDVQGTQCREAQEWEKAATVVLLKAGLGEGRGGCWLMRSLSFCEIDSCCHHYGLD
jgi:hypothetical protein